MKHRDLVLEQIHHRETRPVPYTLDIEDEVAVKLDAHFGNKDWRNRIQNSICQTGVVDTMRKDPTDRAGFERDPFGSIWRVDLRPFHLETPGLASPSFEGFSWPEPEKFFCGGAAIRQARQRCDTRKGERFLVAGLGWGFFETSWGIRGFENCLMDCAAEPDFYAELLDRIANQFTAYLDFTLAELPDVDAILLGDDWGDQRGVIMGADRWRAMFKPRYARLYERIHARGKLVMTHCCGSVAEIIPDLIEIGLDVLESVQPEARGMNPYELKKRWGDKLTFWGGLGSQSTIPFGTPAQIHAEVRRLRREMSIGGGYILSCAKALQPETPVGNAVAVLEAFTSGT